MNATTEDIRGIKPGGIKAFLCEDAKKMQSVATLVWGLKRMGMPEGVVDYEMQRDFEQNIILIHAMRRGDAKVLNR